MQAPHPPLKEYYREEAERSEWVRQMFDCTAADYDRVERAMALGTGSWYRRRALARAGLTSGMRVLDVGPIAFISLKKIIKSRNGLENGK